MGYSYILFFVSVGKMASWMILVDLNVIGAYKNASQGARKFWIGAWTLGPKKTEASSLEDKASISI